MYRDARCSKVPPFAFWVLLQKPLRSRALLSRSLLFVLSVSRATIFSRNIARKRIFALSENIEVVFPFVFYFGLFPPFWPVASSFKFRSIKDLLTRSTGAVRSGLISSRTVVRHEAMRRKTFLVHFSTVFLFLPPALIRPPSLEEL